MSQRLFGSFFLVALLFLSAHAHGARRERLSLGTTEKIPSAGVSIRTFKDANPMPSRAANAHTLRSSDGTRIEAYDPRELWVRDQWLAQWGNSLAQVTVMELKLNPPEDLDRIYQNLVLKGKYYEWSAGDDAIFNKGKRKEWLEYFTGQKIKGEPELLRREGPRRTTTYQYSLTPDTRLFLLEPSDTDKRPFVLFYQLKVPDDRADRVVMQSLSSVGYFRIDEEYLADKMKKTSKASKQSEEYSREYLASKKTVINSIRNLDNWHYSETDNYIIVTNVGSTRTINDLKEQLEKCRKIYEFIFPLSGPMKAISVAKVFEKREEYLAYVGSGLEGSGGVWMSSKKELVVSPVDWANRRDNRKMMLDTLRHEGFHQYIYYATGGVHTATWFNEGNATFFEGTNAKRRGDFEVELTDRAEHMKRSVNLWPGISRIINQSHAEFMSDSRNYVMVYGLMFFLHKGAPVLREENDWKEIPMKYYEAAQKTKNPVKATQIAWQGVDMEAFDKAFVEFWNSDSMVRKAERYEMKEAILETRSGEK